MKLYNAGLSPNALRVRAVANELGLALELVDVNLRDATAKVETLLLVSGRLTWDIMVDRGKRGLQETVAVARTEQLYPWPVEELKAEIASYPNLKTVKWVQDEPFNQGPWPTFALNIAPHLGVPVQVVSRAASTTTAVGTSKRHIAEQQELLDQAFA